MNMQFEHNEVFRTQLSGALESKSEFQSESDEVIWKAFKEGNEAAFVHIYKSYANPLYSFGVKVSSDKELVEDCLQDFFIYLRGSRNKLGDTTSIKLYLFKSFKRRVIEYVTKACKIDKKSKELVDYQFNVELSDETKFINLQTQEEHQFRLKRAMERLDNREREAVYYFYYEGMSYKEIAQMLEFTHVSSARRMIYRAVGNLKKLFDFS